MDILLYVWSSPFYFARLCGFKPIMALNFKILELDTMLY